MALSLTYGEDSAVKMAESASLLPGNLALLREEDGSAAAAYGLVGRHVSSVSFVSSAAGGGTDSKSFSFPGPPEEAFSRTLTGMEWCRLRSSREVLVLTSYRGFRILSRNGSELLYENQFESRKGSYDQRFARGVTSVDNVVCVGTSEGNIIVLYVPPTGSEVVFTRQLQGHSVAITSLGSCGPNQVIRLWTCGYVFPCLASPPSVCLWCPITC
jgi:hypothetical protein